MKNFLRSELIRNTSVLVSGTILAQALYFLLQPVLRRLYTVEDFGIYSSVYLSLVGITAVISTLRYDDAIVLPGKDKDSVNLLALSLIFNTLISVLILVMILVADDQIIRLLKLPPDFRKLILYMVPLGAFLLNVFQAFNYWLIRKKKFGTISMNKVVRRGAESVSQVSLAFSGNKTGLILSDIAGQVANITAAISMAFRNGFDHRHISRTKLMYVARKYTDFPKYSLIPALMSSCSFLLPPLLINRMYSAENAGYFDASKSLLSIPIALIAASFSSVLLQRITQRYNSRESISPEIKQALFIILGVCITEVAVILLFAPWIFRVYFGSQWDESAVISRIMVWSYVLNFIVSAFTCIFFAMRKIRIYSIWQVMYFAGIISLLFFNKLDFIPFLKLYVAVEVSCFLVLLGIMYSLLRNYERTIRTSSSLS